MWGIRSKKFSVLLEVWNQALNRATNEGEIFMFCIKCGNSLQNDAKFCPKCSLAQPQPSPRKRPIPAPLVFLAIVASIAAIVTIVGLLDTTPTAKTYFIQMGTDSVPTVNYVLGVRNMDVLNDATIAQNDGGRKKLIDLLYSSLTAKEDIRQYTGTLLNEYGFGILDAGIIDFNENYNRYTIVKNSTQNGFYLAIEIYYSPHGYQITYTRQSGGVHTVY